MLLKWYTVFWDDFSFCQQGFSALEVDQIFIGFQQHGVRKSDWCFQPAYNNNTSPTTLAGFRDKKKMLLLSHSALTFCSQISLYWSHHVWKSFFHFWRQNVIHIYKINCVLLRKRLLFSSLLLICRFFPPSHTGHISQCAVTKNCSGYKTT